MEIQKIKGSDGFNEKYKDYLTEGHYGMSFDDEQVIDYLDGVFQEFIKREGFEYQQIKLKFGMARFYADMISTDEMIAVESRINELLKDKVDKW